MNNEESQNQEDLLIKQMRANFEADLPQRISRASDIKLQNLIPAHWFAAAASECAGMYISGFFYGAISVSQAYVEALSKFLVEFHHIRAPRKDVVGRWDCLHRKKIVSLRLYEAAAFVFSERNDFHHLNKNVEADFLKLKLKARECVNSIYVIESEIFAYSFEVKGRITPRTLGYWPTDSEKTVKVYIRNIR